MANKKKRAGAKTRAKGKAKGKAGTKAKKPARGRRPSARAARRPASRKPVRTGMTKSKSAPKAKPKSKAKARGTSKATPRSKAKSKSKAPAPAKARSTKRRAPVAARPRRSRGLSESGLELAVAARGLGAEFGGQSGDTQGLSEAEVADSESVEELVEEGQAFEAGIIEGVENAPDADEGEVRTREVPEDDVPEEYRDQD